LASRAVRAKDTNDLEETAMTSKGSFFGISMGAFLFAGLLVEPHLVHAAAFAQYNGPSPAGLAALGALLVVGLFFGLALYIYMSLALQTIAKKTNTPNGWLAWIPIANLVLMAIIAKRPVWWFLLCLIPVVGIVFVVIIWMGIAEARKKPNWWGILLIVPIANLIVPGYLAWAD
jgi:hypothetical protein